MPILDMPVLTHSEACIAGLYSDVQVLGNMPLQQWCRTPRSHVSGLGICLGTRIAESRGLLNPTLICFILCLPFAFTLSDMLMCFCFLNLLCFAHVTCCMALRMCTKICAGLSWQMGLGCTVGDSKQTW